MMFKHFTRTAVAAFVVIVAAAGEATAADAPQTARLYLSGHGPKDAVPWELPLPGAGEPVSKRPSPCLPTGSSTASEPTVTASRKHPAPTNMVCTDSGSLR